MQVNLPPGECADVTMQYHADRIQLDAAGWRDDALLYRTIDRNKALRTLRVNPLLISLSQNCASLDVFGINFDDPKEPDHRMNLVDTQSAFEIQAKNWPELDRVLNITRTLVFYQFQWTAYAKDLLNRLLTTHQHLMIVVKQMVFDNSRWRPDDTHTSTPFEYGDRVFIELAVALNPADVRRTFRNVTDIKPLVVEGRQWSCRHRAYTLYRPPYR
jgi:hypothetical protein